VIQIRSYLKVGAEFVPIESFVGAVPDTQYIEGALEVVVDRVPLIGMDAWDYVDELWAYLIDASLRAAGGAEASLFFPDQPIEVTLHPLSGSRLEIAVIRSAKAKRVRVAMGEFMDVLCDAAELFFRRMVALVPENQASNLHVLAKLERLRDLARGGRTSA
jgi:hypothetical protein